VWFAILGSMQVRCGDADIRIPRPKHRVLLSRLLLSPNQPVSVDELVDAMWPWPPPATAAVTARNYVMRLRHELGPGGERIMTQAPGYMIKTSRDELDVMLFSHLVAEGDSAARNCEWLKARRELARALDLWRSTPLADVPSESLQLKHVPRLELMRLNAIERRLDADLELGHHAAIVPELQNLVAQHPLSERFYEQLMMSLARCGRRAEALAAYQQARHVMRTELGLDPSRALQDLQQQILNGPARAGPLPGRLPDPSTMGVASAREESGRDPYRARRVPRQLPLRMPLFAGRADELSVLARAAELASAGAAQICAISGTAGVGKTTLAIRYAHDATELFSDGQLYVNLRGFGPTGSPVSSDGAIRILLGALADPSERLPSDPQALAARYRSELARRQVLLVLDNARDEEQVRPLLPGSPGTFVIITSRTRLTGLAVGEGATLIDLDVMTGSDAQCLVAQRIGDERVAADIGAITELTQLCAGLPLALSVAAALIAARPDQMTSSLIAELHEARGRLDLLATGDPATDMRGVLSWSLRNISPAAQRLFRLLGLHSGPDISLAASTSLAGMTAPAARKILNELVRAHLLSERAAGRYSFHDLLRLYAAELASSIDDPGSLSATTARIIDHYTGSAIAAAQLIRPARDAPALGSPAARVTLEHFGSYSEALTWFDTERAVLLGVVTLADRTHFGLRAWQLAWALAGFLDMRGHWHDWISTQRTALAAAERLGDVGAQAGAHRSLGCALSRLGEQDRARHHLNAAQRCFERIGDTVGHSRNALNIAHTFELENDINAAIRAADEALELSRMAEDGPGEAAALNAVGWCNLQAGKYDAARLASQRALEIQQLLGDSPGIASALDTLGCAHFYLKDHRHAIACHARAARIFSELGDQFRFGESLFHLGDSRHAAGELRDAAHAWTEALGILRKLRPKMADQLQLRLRDLKG
jgi:DNA-binding SARP family transcriptional activator/tetratricopeptide (TPR) repeat protein